MEQLTLGFSPCPNDTFIFYGLVHRQVSLQGLTFSEPLLEDVETLNSWALEGRLEVTKLSCHALGHVLDEYCVLSAGSALGRGCGPLLVSTRDLTLGNLHHKRIGIPGKYTTAALLLKMFMPGCSRLVEMPFDRIIPAVKSGQLDAGVIIHESRFTYKQEGLIRLLDLGEWWERTSGMPIPLGSIVARRSLGEQTLGRLENVIANSVDYGFSHPDQCLPYIQQHSQELDAGVVQSHIDLYVNAFSRDLGQEGIAAIEKFLSYGREAGVLPRDSKPLRYC